MRSRPFSTLLGTSLLAALTLACDRRATEIRIGCVTSVTGDTATFGRSNQQGYQLAIDEWNAQGGVLGQRIRMVLGDDRSDAGEGATACTKLIERDKVALILGGATSRVTLAGAPIAQAARVPMVTPGATNPKVTLVGDYIFRACFTDAFQGAVGGTFAFRDLKARRAACLFDLGNDYTVGLAEVFRTAFTSQGGTMAGYEGHPAGAVDFRAQLTRILQARPDLIYLPDYYGDAALIARQARELGFRGPLFGADGWDSPQLLAIGGAALENACFTAHCSKDDPDPAVQRFVVSYRARYHSDPDSQAVLAYEACQVALDAIRRAGTTDRAAVRDALAATNLRTVSGQLRYDAQRNPVKPVAILEIRGGRMVFRAKVAP